jgi:hypothetical protein
VSAPPPTRLPPDNRSAYELQSGLASLRRSDGNRWERKPKPLRSWRYFFLTSPSIELSENRCELNRSLQHRLIS